MKGIYLLIIQVGEDFAVDVGALCEIAFKKGLYAYVGSAQNNLEKRIFRHFRKEKKLFWHIDYFLKSENSKIVQVLFRDAPKAEECTLAGEVEKLGKATEGFGCSDCHCKSHLFRIDSYDFLLGKMHKMKM